MKTHLILFLSISVASLYSQSSKYWQQHIDYSMSIDVNEKDYTYTGYQKIIYKNNSPDTLDKIYYHLYFNAFQPNSEMDIRLQNIPDPDNRMVDNIGTKKTPKYESRIAKLTKSEYGFIHVKTLSQNKTPIAYKVEGTILEVTLDKPIKLGEETTLEMTFNGQVPKMIRRSGRNSPDGVEFSMSQWYPKLAEFDFEGWHTDPYLAREFHGVWGNFNVSISINKSYFVVASGYLKEKKKAKKGKVTWVYEAPNVHDFSWAADPDFVEDKLTTKNGVDLYFVYQRDKKYNKNWKKLQEEAKFAFEYLSDNIGQYPWKKYAVIQGGDGGMEYAMCTFIKGGENYKSLLGTTIHEMAHAWFQHALATNEAKHAWMDEGFTSYISVIIKSKLRNDVESTAIFENTYNNYFHLINAKMEEPQTTHSDRYTYNLSYSISAYVKGQIFLSQLEYIIGEKELKNTLKSYFEQFKFKHPTPTDFIRTAERVSGTHLNWYLNEWTQTTHFIDYGIKSVTTTNNNSKITIERIGKTPMPIELTVVFQDGTAQDYYIPLSLMRNEKKIPNAITLKDWGWGFPTYTFDIEKKQIKKIQLGTSLLADVNSKNNTYLITR